MADFIPSKKEASDFNGGVQYINTDIHQGITGDAVQAETINNLVESALYTQDQADTAKTVAESAKDLIDSVVNDTFSIKNLYNLGAYDTSVPNTDGTATITRQTVSILLNGDENYFIVSMSGGGNRFYLGFAANGLPTAAGSDQLKNSRGLSVRDTFTSTYSMACTADNLMISLSGNETIEEFKENLAQNPIYVQYKRADAYTETVINEQPLSNYGIANACPLIGMHHIQFNGEPTPAEIWAGTTWEIDTHYQGRVLVGSGGDYSFGAIGGEASHTLTIAEIPAHGHFEYADFAGGQSVPLISDTATTSQIVNVNGAYFTPEAAGSVTYNSNWLSTSETGNSQSHNIMQPYSVVNYWKRTA